MGNAILPNGAFVMFVWDVVSGMQILSTNAGFPVTINNHSEIAGLFYGPNGIERFSATVAPPVPPTPKGQTAQITASVAALVSTRVLTGASASQNTNSLNSAIASLDKGSVGAAKNQLGAAANKVNALVNSGKLSAADGKKLTDSIAAVAAGL